jgi:hypothetical protein
LPTRCRRARAEAEQGIPCSLNHSAVVTIALEEPGVDLLTSGRVEGSFELEANGAAIIIKE